MKIHSKIKPSLISKIKKSQDHYFNLSLEEQESLREEHLSIYNTLYRLYDLNPDEHFKIKELV